MKEQKIICGDRSRLHAKENRTHEACGAMIAVSREDITFLEEIRHKIIDIPMYIQSSHIRQGIDWYDKYVNKQNQAIQPRDLTNIDDKGE